MVSMVQLGNKFDIAIYSHHMHRFPKGLVYQNLTYLYIMDTYLPKTKKAQIRPRKKMFGKKKAEWFLKG